MSEEIINRVAKSTLVSIDMDDYIDLSQIVEIDIASSLHQGLILRELDFRNDIKSKDWTEYEGKDVFVHCSLEAIIPTWAYMLVATKLSGVANNFIFGDQVEIEKLLIDRAIKKITDQNLENAKVVIKGCGGINSRDYAYFQLTKALVPKVASIMYGEPCSTVPVYKKPR